MKSEPCNQCPSCKRALYNGRQENCGYCGATIPAELRFTPEEIATLDRELKALEESRREGEKAKEKKRAAELDGGAVNVPMIF
ncbi:MAG: hypothetical protein JWM68_5867 [Verrucomicrobiales bacterium]|nr:hypothetical protein [Verrucomicrobiales bacterium]